MNEIYKIIHMIEYFDFDNIVDIVNCQNLIVIYFHREKFVVGNETIAASVHSI